MPQFIELSRQHDVAIVCADAVEWPRITDVTSGFVYCRLHGSQELYASGYDPVALEQWTEWVLPWARGGQPSEDAILKPAGGNKKSRDVFVYFDNDAKVRAPVDAQELIKRVSTERKVRVSADRTNRQHQFGPYRTVAG